MINVLGTFTLLASALLVLGGVRMIAQDTYQTFWQALQNARSQGILVPRIAFLLLWALIFSLSYL